MNDMRGRTAASEIMGSQWKIFIHSVFACILIALLAGCNKNTGQPPTPGPPWLTFNKASNQLVDDHVNALYTDADGIVWVATDSGASYFNHGTWSSFVDQLSYPIFYNGGSTTASSVTSITQGFDRSVWFGLKGGGIARYNQFGQTFVWKRYTTSDGIPYNYVLSVDRGQTPGSSRPLGEVWCTTIAGIAHFLPSSNEGGTWTIYNSSNSTLPDNQVRAVGFNFNDYSVWFSAQDPSSGGSAIAYIDGNGRWQPAIALASPYNLPIVAIAFDARNTVWFAKWQGVSSFNTQTLLWHHYTNATTIGKLPPGNVNAVTTNFATVRWFATNAGLVRLSDTTWTTFKRINIPQLPSDTVTALTIDRNSNLWIGTPNGVAVFNEAGTKF